MQLICICTKTPNYNQVKKFLSWMKKLNIELWPSVSGRITAKLNLGFSSINNCHSARKDLLVMLWPDGESAHAFL